MTLEFVDKPSKVSIEVVDENPRIILQTLRLTIYLVLREESECCLQVCKGNPHVLQIQLVLTQQSLLLAQQGSWCDLAVLSKMI